MIVNGQAHFTCNALRTCLEAKYYALNINLNKEKKLSTLYLYLPETLK